MNSTEIPLLKSWLQKKIIVFFKHFFQIITK
jgi:hypothetical protein